MRLIIIVGLISVLAVACNTDKTYERLPVPETTTLDISEKIDLKDYLDLTEQQKKKWEEIELKSAERHLENMDLKDSTRAEVFEQINIEYDNKIYAILDKEQKERFLDYKAYQRIRRQSKSIKRTQSQ